MPKKSKHYCNKEEFYQEMIVWLKAKEKNKNLPVPNSIGKKIYEIVYRYSFRSNFINYTFKDRFIGDALYTCIRYADRFNYKKYNNPFAYFTKIAWSSFVKCILEERKVSKLKKTLYDNFKQKHNTRTKKDLSDYFDLQPPQPEWNPIKLTTKEGKVYHFEHQEDYLNYYKKLKEKREKKIEKKGSKK